jgi:hypothetical protein
VATSTGITGKTSWWWSADGNSWKDAQLTTTATGWATLDSGYMVVDLPAPAAASTPTPAKGAPTPAPSPWVVWASKDGRIWQQPASSVFYFGVPNAYGVASSGGHVVIVGWSKAGILQAYFGDLTGF